MCLYVFKFAESKTESNYFTTRSLIIQCQILYQFSRYHFRCIVTDYGIQAVTQRNSLDFYDTYIYVLQYYSCREVTKQSIPGGYVLFMSGNTEQPVLGVYLNFDVSYFSGIKVTEQELFVSI